MESEYQQWAPPTIGDVRLPDRDLGRRLSREPRVHMRAKMLGMDWSTLASARIRLLVGAWLISATVALLVLAPAVGQIARGGQGMLLVTVALVIGAAVAAMIPLRSVSSLPVLIARNHESTADRYAAAAKRAPIESLLGYRARWILLGHLATTISAVALTALAVEGWWMVVPTALTVAAIAAVAGSASRAGHPIRAIVVRLTGAGVLLVAVAQFALTHSGAIFFGLAS
jgi:hypothetical protein